MSNTASWADLMQTAEKAGLSFEPVPDGSYECTISKAEGTTSSNGKAMIKVTFDISAGPYQGKKVFNQFVISPESENAMAFFFRHMAVLGLNAEFFATCPPPLQGGSARIAATILGKACRVTVGHKEYNGTLRNEVKGISTSSVASGVTGVAPPVVAGVPAPVTAQTPPVAPVPQTTPTPDSMQANIASVAEAPAGDAPKPPF